jgi:hypothetical protein
MVSKAADVNTFLSHLELLLCYHEGSNSIDSLRVLDGPVDGRQAAVLKRLDNLLITKGKGDAKSNDCRARVEPNPIQRDLSPDTDMDSVCPQSFLVGRILTVSSYRCQFLNYLGRRGLCL